MHLSYTLRLVYAEESSTLQKQPSYSFCTRQRWLKPEYFIVVNQTAKSPGTRAISIGINERFPIFCCFCNELCSSPANHFSADGPTLQLFSSIHRSRVLGGLCLLPHVPLQLSNSSSVSALWTFGRSRPCTSSQLSWPRSVQSWRWERPQCSRACSPVSFYLPKWTDSNFWISTVGRRTQTKLFQSLSPHLGWLRPVPRLWAFPHQQLHGAGLWKPSHANLFPPRCKFNLKRGEETSCYTQIRADEQ